MKSCIIKPNPKDEFDTIERCSILESLNSETDPAVSIAQARVKPGVVTAWHQLTGIAERYVIIAGEGLMEVGDLPAQSVQVGDVVSIPPDVRQRISNTGSGDLIFYAICTPRFLPHTYVDLEATAD